MRKEFAQQHENASNFSEALKIVEQTFSLKSGRIHITASRKWVMAEQENFWDDLAKSRVCPITWLPNAKDYWDALSRKEDVPQDAIVIGSILKVTQRSICH